MEYDNSEPLARLVDGREPLAALIYEHPIVREGVLWPDQPRPCQRGRSVFCEDWDFTPFSLMEIRRLSSFAMRAENSNAW